MASQFDRHDGGLGLDDDLYRLDKTKVLRVIDFIAQAINEGESLGDSLRDLSKKEVASSSKEVNDLINDSKMSSDILTICMKEARAMMISMTKDQLPF